MDFTAIVEAAIGANADSSVPLPERKFRVMTAIRKACGTDETWRNYLEWAKTGWRVESHPNVSRETTA